MERALSPAVASDAEAVTEVAVALETALYGATTYSQADLEDEWSGLDLERDALVLREGERVVGYGALEERGELCHAEGQVHPDVHGRGIGRMLATALEHHAAERGARRIHNRVFEADAPGRDLLASLGYEPVRVFREMRVDLDAPPPAPAWPGGLRPTPFDPERDARAFHAAHQEAFADHWEFAPRPFDTWAGRFLEGDQFDPALWCVVRDGDDIAAGTISTGATYGGGFVHVLFTRRPWRRQGVGAALLHDAFGRFWERDERSIGLGVDAASATGAFRLYERAGMSPALGWVHFEKVLGDSP